MNVVILDGTPSDMPVGEFLTNSAGDIGATVRRFPLADHQIAPCLGDFECWIKTPGVCRTRDVIGEIMEAMTTADLVVFLTPIVFGGYSAELKKAVDRLLGLIHPFFKEQDGLTRHFPRYQRYARLLVIGLAERIDDEAANIFREMAAGNAINLQSPAVFTQLVSTKADDWQDKLGQALRSALGPARGTSSSYPAPDADSLMLACAADPLNAGDPPAPRSATLLIGSARPKGSSTSESLARELIAGLNDAQVATTVVYASQFIKPGRATDDALQAMLDTDLLVIAAPLYVDGLPSLVCRALEQLTVHLDPKVHALRRVCGIINCGYPEAIHSRIAMRLLRNFAHQNQLIWAGGLPLGGGEIIHGRPLRSSRVLLRGPIRALQMAANALANGHPIPLAASELMARQLVPSWLFRWAARVRWTLQAKPNGVGWHQLAARPYETRLPPDTDQTVTTAGH